MNQKPTSQKYPDQILFERSDFISILVEILTLNFKRPTSVDTIGCSSIKNKTALDKNSAYKNQITGMKFL